MNLRDELLLAVGIALASWFISITIFICFITAYFTYLFIMIELKELETNKQQRL